MKIERTPSVHKGSFNINDAFVLRASEFGGCVGPFDWDEEQRARAEPIKALFSNLTSIYLKESVPEEAIPWVESLTLDWIVDPSVNALAMHSGAHCHVALFSGITDRLWEAFVLVSAHPLHFKSLPGALPIEELQQVSPTKPVFLVPSIIQHGCDSRLRDILRSFDSVPSPRINMASELYRIALEFLIMHEIHHFWCGHIFYGNSLLEKGLTLAATRLPPETNPLMHQAFEWHADYLSIKRLVALYKLKAADPETFLKTWITALGVLFLIFHPNPCDLAQWHSQHYPHPHVRFTQIAAALCAHAQEEFQIAENDVDGLLNSALHEVALIDVAGKGEILNPFHFAFQHNVEAKTQSDSIYVYLKQILPALEDARLRMLAGFAQS